MSEEEISELQEYNLEYLEAQQSEELFGGDYTSAVELKYAKKEIERLNTILNNIHNYIEKMSYCEIVDNPKKELSRILEKESDNYGR